MYGSTSYVMIEQVQNGVMYIMYRTSSKITLAEWYKALIGKTFSYSIVKHTPRVSLILLTVEQIGSEIFDFVIVVILLLYFHSHITQKLGIKNFQ